MNRDPPRGQSNQDDSSANRPFSRRSWFAVGELDCAGGRSQLLTLRMSIAIISVVLCPRQHTKSPLCRRLPSACFLRPGKIIFILSSFRPAYLAVPKQAVCADEEPFIFLNRSKKAVGLRDPQNFQRPEFSMIGDDGKGRQVSKGGPRSK